MKRVLLTGTIFLMTVGMIVPSLQAAGRGANPNGKPFVELQGQIIEVEGELASLDDQIDSIVGRVASMEERIYANEGAIADLFATNVTLQAELDTNAGDIFALQEDIVLLQQQNADLQDQIDSSAGNVADLQDQIDYNHGLISAMQLSISGLGQDLQDQIDHNALLIIGMQAQIESLNELLALRSLLENGECLSGEALREILPDGSVVCEPAGSEGSTYNIAYSRKGGAIQPGQHVTVKAHCPTGWIATGGGFDKGWWIDFAVNGPTSYGTGNAWQVRFIANPYWGAATNFVTAVCLGPMN